jgi:CHASE2 domain-containing sensor protein
MEADRSRPKESRAMPRNALFASIIAVLALVAAVVSLVQGWWPGVIWVLMTGVFSNIAWYHLRRARQAKASAQQG